MIIIVFLNVLLIAMAVAGVQTQKAVFSKNCTWELFQKNQPILHSFWPENTVPCFHLKSTSIDNLEWFYCHPDVVCPEGKSYQVSFSIQYLCKLSILQRFHHWYKCVRNLTLPPQTLYVGSNQKVVFRTQQGSSYGENVLCKTVFKVCSGQNVASA